MTKMQAPHPAVGQDLGLSVEAFSPKCFPEHREQLVRRAREVRFRRCCELLRLPPCHLRGFRSHLRGKSKVNQEICNQGQDQKDTFTGRKIERFFNFRAEKSYFGIMCNW